MSMSIIFLFLVLVLLNYYALCLKIKLNSLELYNSVSLRTQGGVNDQLIMHLVLNGPFSILAGLISLETSINFRSIVAKQCFWMTSETVLSIFKEFHRGELTDKQFNDVLSADCISKWRSIVFQDLSKLGMLRMLPVNPLESKHFLPNRVSVNDLMEMIESAWSSPVQRKRMIWNRWTSSLTTKQFAIVARHPLWKRTAAWQIITFRNYLTIKESDVMLKTNLVYLVGLEHESESSLQSFSIGELIQRSYTLISFVKLAEIDHKKTSSASDHLSVAIFQSIISEIVKNFLRINKRIKEIDVDTSTRLFRLFGQVIEEIKQNQQDPNEIFRNFLRDLKGVELGDWLIEIFCILFNQIRSINEENLTIFMKEFFARNPSIDSIRFLLRLFEENSIHVGNFLLKEYMEKRTKDLKLIYKSASRVLLPPDLIHSIPLKARIYQNLKNRNVEFRRLPSSSFKLDKLKVENELEMFLEMVGIFAWNHFNLNLLIVYRDVDSLRKLIGFHSLLEIYFKTFLKLELFHYKTGSAESRSQSHRPIIRILPVFPVALWYQLGHLMSRAILLRIEIPFIIDFDFFKEAFNPDGSSESVVFLEMQKIFEESTDLMKGLFDKLEKTREDWDDSNIIKKLKSLFHELETIKHSSTDTIDTITETTNCRESIKQGFKSFANGLRSGMNFDDFTIDEAYSIIFTINHI